jgi:hypothetical protein
MEDPAWVGSPLDAVSVRRIRRLNFSDLPICPTLQFQIQKRRLVRFLSQVVVWHSGRPDMAVLTGGYRAMAAAGENVFLTHIRDGMSLCQYSAGAAGQWNQYWEERA